MQFTKSLAIAWAPDKIRVNALAPGWIQTELTRPLYEDDQRSRQITDRTPMNRWGNLPMSPARQSFSPRNRLSSLPESYYLSMVATASCRKLKISELSRWGSLSNKSFDKVCSQTNTLKVFHTHFNFFCERHRSQQFDGLHPDRLMLR